MFGKVLLFRLLGTAEPKASEALGKCSTTQLHSARPCYVAQAGLEPLFPLLKPALPTVVGSLAEALTPHFTHTVRAPQFSQRA